MNTIEEPYEKRRFTRVPFVNHIALSQDNQSWIGNVVDVSFNGILIHFDADSTIDPQTTVAAIIHFDNDANIHADLTLAHNYERFYGFSFSEIDSESLTHLRNIISHNLGDTKACERELISLFSYHQ
jgi:hypothetical protein